MKALIIGGDSDIAVELIKLLHNKQWEIVKTTRQEILNSSDCKQIKFEATNTSSYLSDVINEAKNADVVVSFIGYLPDESQDLTNDQITQTIQVNLTSIIEVVDPIAKHFKTRGNGKIIGVSSVAGERGKARNPIYSAAKAGFTAYLSGLRNKLSKHNVQVTTVLPGFVSTKMTEGLDLPKTLTVTPEIAAKKIYKACTNNTNVVYISGKWRLIMWIIRHIPESIYKKMDL